MLFFSIVYSSTIEIFPDSSLFTITDDFHGIQYNKYVFSSEMALDKMEPLQIKWIRMWAYPRKFHPNKNQWDWTGTG